MFEMLAQASQPAFQTLEDFGNWQTLVAGAPILGGVVFAFWRLINLIITTMKEGEARYQAFAKEITQSFKESSKEITEAVNQLGEVVQGLRDAVRDSRKD